MFSRFFIDRPIFATVLSFVIVIIGGVALLKLPIAQYPEVTPPTVQVTANYPGANARVVAETVATPIEQEINGVENMLYMSSKCTNDGAMSLDVTFNVGTNLDMAQVLVQNRVAIAQSKLPEEVRRQGVTTKKRSPSILLCINLISDRDAQTGKPIYDLLYLSNFATMEIKDMLARIPGVGDVTFLGPRDYSMRIWLDPRKLATRDMNASDVVQAIREQNVQVAAGRLGQPPTPPGQSFQLTLNTLGRLQTEDEFQRVVVKTGEKGQNVYLADVVRDNVSRIQLDPAKLKAQGLSADDVFQSLHKNNVQINLDPIDKATSEAERKLHFQIKTFRFRIEDSLMSSANGTKNALLKELVQDKDGIVPVEKGVELGAKNYDVSSYLDEQPSITFALFQLPGSNAVETADAIKETMRKLKQDRFPAGIDYRIVYDTTTFVEESVHVVYETLIEAFILVFIVVLLFLQDWRVTILPMIEVPVSLIGTFGVMALLGFSLNNLTLFGLVLAIGIVVDDAIVVIENVERWMAKGLDPKEATRRAMDEVTGAVLAIALVLCAVFIPTAFMSGISGQFYRQFALTIAASTIISALNALTMTPARCALIMRPHQPGHEHEAREALPPFGVALLGGWLFWRLFGGLMANHPDMNPWLLWLARGVLVGVGAAVGWYLTAMVNRFLNVVFAGFNWIIERATLGYSYAVRGVLRVSVIMLFIYGGLMGMTYFGFSHVPVGFIPEQDKGYLVVNAQLPDGASLDRTEAVMARLTDMILKTEGVEHVISLPGYSVLTSNNISSTGGMFVILKPFAVRAGKAELSASAVMDRLQLGFRSIQEAYVLSFGAPPVDGLGNTGGFKLQVEDRSGAGLEALQGAVQSMVEEGNAQPGLFGLFSSFSTNQPQVYIDIDRIKAKSSGVSLTDLFDTLQVYLGSSYVNDITLLNRNWQVNVQADAKFRLQRDDIGKLEVRSSLGRMVPLSTLIAIREVSGPAIVNHYNMYPSAEINGNTAPGTSSGQAISLMQEIAAKKLPRTMGYEWTELTFLQILAEKDLLTKLVFPLAVIFVYLTLAAQYESWSLPAAIILIVPMCLLSAITGVWLKGSDNNIFTQIGLVVLIGLAAKNAILIVEFAKQRQDEGLSRFDAAVEACRLRLRPILMTSFAFILGVAPLVVSIGAGAEMRQALGVAVFSGMIGVTLFGIFFTPVFYVVIRWFIDKE